MTERLLSNLSEIKANIDKIRKEIDNHGGKAVLMAVTKNFCVDCINEAIDAGVTVIGENRVQELLSKIDNIKNRDKIKIHLIGHLQTNKVKYVVGKVDMIESVDSLRLAVAIGRCSAKNNTVTEILVQLNMGNEENKTGISPDDTEYFLREISVLPGIKVKGLMGVIPKMDENNPPKKYFLQLFNIFLDIRAKNIDNIDMDILSMGMSNDYIDALDCGSTLIRIGSGIFGKRKYK